MQRARVKSRLGDRQGAISDYGLAISGMEKMPDVWDRLKFVSATTGVEEKLVAFVYTARADHYVETGQCELAAADYRSAIQKDPQAAKLADPAEKAKECEAKKAGAPAPTAAATAAPPTAAAPAAAAAQPAEGASSPPAAPATGDPSVEERLKKLQELKDQKLISDEEYQRERQRILQAL